MELKSELRHTRSLSTSSLCDQPTSILWDRSTSVSQLVARYQMTTENHIRENVEIKVEAKPKQMPQRTLETKVSHLEARGRGNDDNDQSPAKTSLARSKSMGSLQNKVVSIQALKARFESKEDTEKVKNSLPSSRSTETTQKMTEEPQKISDPPLETKQSPPKALERKHDKRQPSLVHSKSTGSLQSSSGSIGALRARFESKVDAQNTVRAIKNSPASIKSADITHVNDGEVEQEKDLKETSKNQTAAAPVKEEKNYRSSQKVVTQQRRERRKTIGGIDFEKMVAIKANEKRQSFAGFSNSPLDQNKDRLSISVKAISALFLTKMAAQEPTNGLLQHAQDQSPQSGRTFKSIKMAEDSRQTSDDLHPPVPSRQQPYNSSESHFQPATGQVVKGNLHQQRQKCELRRLLKHTYPELKRLDDVLDEELAEVLSSDTGGPSDESGYEGEVLSRRLIFENFTTTDAYFPPRQPVESENSKTAKCEMQEEESMEHTEEDDMKINVQATRRIFEGQFMSTSRQNPEKSHRKVSSFEDQRQVSKEESKRENLQNRNTALTSPLHPYSPDHEFSGREDERGLLNLEVEDKIKTSAALFKNNPFITANIERETKSHNATGESGEHQDCLTANVKERAYLFESLPFDKIKHQNKDEVEAMVENIKGTLNCLYHANVIHSGGSIVEVSETMIAKKAKFTLSDVGPLINYDEVAQGGAQNFILQLIPRAHLKPQITYLKEDKKGTIEATIVNVGFHQEMECKTAQLVQVVEDILHQDNSLWKGVIIQKDAEAWADVMVYSLYRYFDEKDVKSYCPPQTREYEELQPESGARELSTGEAESLMSSSVYTPKDQTHTRSIRPEITPMGNVKLFKTCIEKGDLEYLKALHVDSTVEEFPSMNNVATQGSALHPEQMDNLADVPEWVPVDVEKLKKMFSGDGNPTQPKQKEGQLIAQRSAGTASGQNTNLPSTVCDSGMFSQQKLKENSTATTWQTCAHLQTQDKHVIHKAELAEVVADCDEISNLQFAINALQQATIEAKTLHEKQKSLVQEVAKQSSDVKQLREETLTEESKDKDQLTSPKIDYPSASDIPAELKLDLLQKNTEENHQVTHTEAHSEPSSGCASRSEIAAEEQEGEVIFEGKLQAALESLERSNINVTRGDFKAAMIYRNSSKNHKKAVDASTEAFSKEEVCPFSEPQSAQGNADTSRPASAEKCRSVGPKPAIPPKPECLKIKRDAHSTNKSNSVANVKSGSANLQKSQLKDEESHQVKGSTSSMESNRTEEKIKNGQQNFMVAEKNSQDTSVEESMTETNKPEECHKIEKKSVKKAPMKPKRVKIVQGDHKSPKQNIGDSNSQILTGISVKQGSNVEMRDKKGQSETEAERRQRLSVHMDEIVNGNIAAAMEIFDNLRKQEELQSILSRVEEIERDTSGVDVRSLRGVFENVPGWVVTSDRKKPNRVKDDKQEERMALIPSSAENKTSMAHVFGNLERASEEILTLKEQTLSRLMDIEEAIKKALYSVSTLKSESDIAGLSSLFQESFGTGQVSPSSANISKISIGSCRAKPVLNWESPAEESSPLPGVQAASTGVTSAKPQTSPSSSSAYISIHSAARLDGDIPTCQHSPKTEEKFLTTATLTCNGERRGGQKETCNSPKRELSVLEVRTDHEGNTFTVTERKDSFGNKLYSSTASAVIAALPEGSMS